MAPVYKWPLYALAFVGGCIRAIPNLIKSVITGKSSPEDQ